MLKKCHHALSWMYFCDYFALSNWQNWEVIFLIPIFGVIYGHNLGIWPPGVSLYCVTTCCLAINFEEILSCFVLNVLCSYFVLSKGPNWEVICIIPIFRVILVKIGEFDHHPGWPYFGLYGSNHKNNTRNGLFDPPNCQKWAITWDFV
jgi:hypothetical protein